MQFLKGIVASLALLILLAMGGLAWGLYQKANDPGFKLFKLAAEPSVPSPGPVSFGELRAPAPEGCTVVEMVPAGERLFLRLGPDARCDRVVVVDLARGVVQGTIKAGP